MEYCNYKGWTSILAVAFVDSYYRFFDVDVGFPGRAGDNTVLRNNWLMKAVGEDRDRWLGPGGVILGDSGAGDGGNVFLNPYHTPTAEQVEKLWFNFCHSSTRFFVEQVFGIYKSRFRCLLAPLNVNHRCSVKIIYATAILHNYFIVHSRDIVAVDEDKEPAWTTFFKEFASHRCPTCVRDKKLHCVHQASYRNGGAQQKQAREKGSEFRDALCSELWGRVVNDPCGQDRVAAYVADRAARDEAADV